MEKPIFKYKTEIDEFIIGGASFPNLYDPMNRRAYRFVFKEDHPNNHKPVYIQNPKRAISVKENSNFNTSGYALSCFEHKDNAIEKYNELRSNNQNIDKSIGNSLCSGPLDNNDGLVTKTSKTGHFDLYEYKECNLSLKFEIIESLI